MNSLNGLNKRIISLILALLTLTYVISSAGCNTDSPEPDDTSENTATFFNALHGYTLMRGDTCGNDVTQAALTLRKALIECGNELPIATDYTKNEADIPADAAEILIGKTNRAASLKASEGLDKYDYVVRMDGRFLVITGGSDMAVAKAVDKFIELYINGKQNIEIPEDLNLMYVFEKTDNSALMPAYVSDEHVRLEPCETDGDAMTPDWAKTLIMMEVHLETATPEGTFKAAVKVLDHCAEMGVNGIWLTPIYEKGAGGNGYGNCGPHTVEPALTGTTDTEESWKVVKEFIDEAHKRNIRVLLDIITWGTVTAAPLYAEHPEWYSGEAWGNQAFNWKNEEFVEWFISVCTDNIIKTGADGYRCDCEPNYTGYKVFDKIRARCLEAGRKILVVAEDGCMRKDCFDFEQDGMLWYEGWSRGNQYQTPKRFYIDELKNIVDSVKNGIGIGAESLQSSRRGGNYRFYTFCVSNHDYQYSITNGNRLVIGYQAIFAPFIPLWYFGAEFNMQAESQVIYFVPVDWSKLDDESNLMFFEDVKKYIKIRRTYPEIFEYFPDNHRDSNICNVTAAGTDITAYARYANNKAVIIVPNNSGKALETTVTIPYAEANITGYATYTVTDLLSGTDVPLTGDTFNAQVENEYMGVYLVEGKQ